MALSAAAVGYCTVGGLVLFSGIKGSTLSDTVKSVLSGNLDPPDVETVNWSGPDVSSTSVTDTDVTASGNNYMTIADFLVSNGYTPIGASGIVGCIAGESGGNPEASSGSGIGLIQWTGSSQTAADGYTPLTGNPTTDLRNQLEGILKYNEAQGENLIKMLNQQPSPVAAADFYSEYFERPAVTDSDVRANIANEVYQELMAESKAVSSATNSASSLASSASDALQNAGL